MMSIKNEFDIMVCFFLIKRPRIGLLFESYIKNFDEELNSRRGTENFWTEEELFNTFQACLSGLKIFHDVFIFDIKPIKKELICTRCFRGIIHHIFIRRVR